MPRGKKNPPATERPLCKEEGCPSYIVAIGADGFGICEDRHVGQPIPDGWTPNGADAPPVGENEIAPDGELRLVDDDYYEDPDYEQQGKMIEIPAELYQGRPIVERRAAFSGPAQISMYRVEAREWWEGLRQTARGTALVGFEVVSDFHQPVKREGVVIGLADGRRLKITGVVFPESQDPTEGLPMWEKLRRDQYEQVENLTRAIAATESLDDVKAFARAIREAMGMVAPDSLDAALAEAEEPEE